MYGTVHEVEGNCDPSAEPFCLDLWESIASLLSFSRWVVSDNLSYSNDKPLTC